jgi:[ribosomal protein S5]-alanine N-acetyltransferase
MRELCEGCFLQWFVVMHSDKGGGSMLKGKSILLRLVHQSDLNELYARHIDLVNRGRFYPLGLLSEIEFRRRFEDKGFWDKEEGMMLIVDADGKILGHIEFFKTVNYLDELELSYQIYEQGDRGRGYATEAVNLMVRYLFGRLKMYRIRLIIHPENRASRRVAEKCGFTHEGTARCAWYHQGRNHDVEVYAILRDEVNPAEIFIRHDA